MINGFLKTWSWCKGFVAGVAALLLVLAYIVCSGLFGFSVSYTNDGKEVKF